MEQHPSGGGGAPGELSRPDPSHGLGTWFLALAAGGLWLGILIAGVPQDGLPAAAAALILVAGAGSVIAAMRVWPSFGRLASAAAVLACFALLGAGWAGIRSARVRASPLARMAGQVVTVRGSLSDDPEAGALGWTASVSIGELYPDGVGRPGGLRLHDEIWVEGHGRAPPMEAGDRVELQGELQLSRGDFGRYLRLRGYPATFSADRVSRLGPTSSLLLRAADALRNALRRSVVSVLPGREGALLMGLALGDTSRQDGEVDEDFRATGLSHLTAVSGENVAMFLAPIMALVGMLGLGRRARFAVGLLAVTFFVLLTRAEPSVMRAAMMSGLAMMGIFLGRPRSPPAIMGGAVLILLGINPTLVYAIGFQLSVAATAGMAMLSGHFAERLRFLPTPLALAAATTIGAQAGVTPLLLYHFAVVPTVTIPANLLAFPAVSPGMLLGLLAAVIGLVSPGLGHLVADVARLPLAYLLGLADRLARSPLPSVTSAPGRLSIVVVGFGLVALLAWWLQARRKFPRPALVVAVLLLPAFVWTHATRAGPPGHLTVTFLTVDLRPRFGYPDQGRRAGRSAWRRSPHCTPAYHRWT